MKTVFNFLRVGYGKPINDRWGVYENITPYNRLHIPISGGANVIFGGETRASVEVGNVYIFPSNSEMRMEVSKGCEYEHLYLDFYVSPPIVGVEHIVIEQCKDETLKLYADLLLSILKRKNGGYVQLDYRRIPNDIEHFLNSLLLYIFKNYGIKQIENQRMAQAIEFIYTHYSEDIGNEEIAESIYVHPRHLARLFKEELNMTPHQFLTEYRINMAINMLEQGIMVKDVCFKCGFKDVKTFRRVFKRMNYLTPSAYASKEE